MNFFLVLIYFLREEIKINFRRIQILRNFFLEFSIFRFFVYSFNESFIPSRNKVFRNYIIKNSKKWRENKNNSKDSNNKNVLITSVFNNVGYITGEIVIGKNLMEMFNASGIALLNHYDLKGILLFKSFGIDKIIILKNLNIFIRLKYFIKAYSIIKSCKNMDEFINFGVNNLDIGKLVYDHYLRSSGVGTTNEFKLQFYAFLAKSLSIYDQLDKYFKKYKIIASVQTEKQFIPGAVIFQTTLLNDAKVYSRTGHPGGNFSVRKYSNINEKYSSRTRFSKKLYDLIDKKIRKEAVEIGGEIIKKRFQDIPEYKAASEYYGLPEFTKGKKGTKIEKIDITKKELCKKLGWYPSSPIGVIFATDLTDGVFDSSWSLFRDRLTWLRETLFEIKKINNINWLVKPHPNDEINNVITNTTSEYEKICIDCNHIKSFPNNIKISSIPKFIDLVVTIGGNAGTEYSCFGIPVILTAETTFSGMGYTIEPESKEKYFFQLRNAKKLKKLNNQQIEAAKIFTFVEDKLKRISNNLIAAHGVRHVDEKNYWTEMTKLLEQYNQQEDTLKKMMKIQEKNNDRHAVDYRLFEKKELLNRGFVPDFDPPPNTENFS